MAKGTTKIGKTVVKGATDADKQTIAAAKASVKAEASRPTRTEETAEAKTSIPAKKAAAAKQFARADMAANETLEETTARMAARGF